MAQGEDDDQRRILNPLDSWQTGAPDDSAPDADTSWLDADDEDVTVPGWSDPEPAPGSRFTGGLDDDGDLELHLEGLTDPEPTEPRRPSWLDPEPDTAISAAEPDREDADSDAESNAAATDTAADPTPAHADSDAADEPMADDDVADADPTAPGTPLPNVATPPHRPAPDSAVRNSNADSVSAEALLTDHEAASARRGGRRFPVWSLLILLAAVALLVVGGWGALKERETLKAEIDRLERQVQGSRSQGDLTAREEQALLSDNQSLRRELDSLRSRYTDLSVEIDRLSEALAQAGIGAGAAAPANSDLPVEAGPDPVEGSEAPSVADGVVSAGEQSIGDSATTSTPSRPAPATPAPADPAVPAGGPWFVNVASYNSRDTAARWARRVQERFSRVAIQEAAVTGKTLYRVRVLGFPDQPTAKAAAAELESSLDIGPLWVGKLSAAESAALDPEAMLEATPTDSGSPTRVAPVESTPAPAAVALREPSPTGGWFIFVDTYARSTDATTRAEAIRDAGYDAKVAVEARAGELFYRVQVVGIASEAEGEAIVAELARTQGLTNLQLRRF